MGDARRVIDNRVAIGRRKNKFNEGLITMNTCKPAVAALLIAAATVTARADTTNLVENIQIHLTGLSQGSTTTSRNTVTTSVDAVNVETAQIIQSLAKATGQTFSKSSRLVLLTPLGGGDSSVQVWDGSVEFDVSTFFSLQTVGAPVTSSTTNTKNGNTTSDTYSVQQFVLQDSYFDLTLNTHFNVSGLGTDVSANHPIPGPDNRLDVNVSGSGDRNGTAVVLEGTVSVSGQTLQVVPTLSGGGN
jgi:hypothetical protein